MRLPLMARIYCKPK